MKIVSSLIKCFFAPFMVILLTTTMVGCSEDKDELQAGDGYVQFKLYKSASYDQAKTRAMKDKLEYLNEAKKMQVVLLHNNVTITQTVDLSAYNSTDAEYGLRSDKLELTAGEYQLIGYYLFDKVEKPILAGEPAEPTTFVVTSGGLVIQDVIVNVVERGKVNFTLVKDLTLPTTRVASHEEPFSSIYQFKVRVRNIETKKEMELDNIKVKYKESFDKNKVLIATATTDTTLYLPAGTYKFIEYYLFNKDNKTKFLGYSNEFPENLTFTVEDNKETKTDLPVRVGLADYLNDYLALKEIWKSLNGEKWSYTGELYPRGANWSFDDKQLDMWGNQPGVNLDTKGRVTFIDIGGFGPKGDLSPMIGQLTELKTLTIGSHNDAIGGGPVEKYGANPTPEQMKIIREDYYNKFLARDPREGFSKELQLGFELKGKPIQKKQRGDISLLDVQFGKLTNEVTSIPDEIGNCEKIQQFYLANSKVSKLPSTMAKLTNCSDLEVYNCPEMKEFPEVLAEMTGLQLVVLATNKQWTTEVLEAGLTKIANGEAGKSLQVLYLGNNNLETLPDLSKIVKLGKLDCINNKISKITKAFPATTHLAQLTMDYNKISSIPVNEQGTFCGFANMETFSFSNNELTELPDIFDAKAIYVMGGVNFANNKIATIENEGTTYRGINASTVDLSFNKLTKFPAILFKSGSTMGTLNLAGNSIEKFPKGSLEGKNTNMLTTLDLRFNKLSELPEDFDATKMPFLYGIDLSYNRFTAFPFEPLYINGLTVYSFRHQRDADGNRCMREWPKGVYKHNSLRALYLGSNDIRKVEDEQLSYTIFNLDISDNPNIIIDVSSVCYYISAKVYNLYYDRTQDIRGCDILDLK